MMTEPLAVVDGRFAALRKRCEVRIKPRTGISSWFEECVLGSIELFDFVLEDRVTTKVLARISVWEMDGLGYRWQMPAIGIVETEVEPGLRKQAMWKFLLYQMLRYLQDQFFSTAEVHIDSENRTWKAYEASFRLLLPPSARTVVLTWKVNSVSFAIC